MNTSVASNLFEFQGTADELQVFINDHEHPACVMFHASWCPSCHRLRQLLPGLLADFPNVIFIRINVEENKQTAKALGITIIPYSKVLVTDRGQLDELFGISGSNVREYREQLSCLNRVTP